MPRSALIGIGCFLILYVTVLAMFLGEGRPSLTITGIDPDAVTIEAEFITVDLIKDTLTLTLIPDLTKPTIAARGRLLRDVAVEVDTGTSVQSHLFRRGEVPVPWQVTVPIERGDQLDYPFDRHSGDFLIRVQRDGTPGLAPGLDLDKIMHGFQMQASAQPTDDRTRLNVAYVVSRSGSVVLLALLAMGSLLLVVLSAINVAWQVTMNGRKVEFSMMTWIAALLFVIPAVRSGLPGGPPAGALVDVVLFFWLHALTAGSLLSVVWTWTRSKG